MTALRTTSVTLNADRHVTLDCYVTEPLNPPIGHISVPDRRPAIIIFPGGGYRFLADREALPVALPFIGHGYQAFVLNYSVGDHAGYPHALIDASQAVRYVRLHASEYNIDPDEIAIIGFSAGGHLAALLATQWHMDHWKDDERSELIEPAMADVSNAPNAAILGYAVTRLTELHPESAGQPYLDPVLDVSALTPPCFLWHTAEDETVPVSHSIEFASALINAGVNAELHVFANGPHGVSVGNRLTDYGIEHEVPANVTSWMPMAIAWLNARFGY